jgi:arginyl-tRNA synthetase
LILINKGELIIPETFNGINAEIPPEQFDSDISTNVAMVLSKLNKKSPIRFSRDKYLLLLKIKIL